MFVLSLKTTRPRVLAGLAAVLLLLALIVTLSLHPRSAAPTATAAGTAAGTANQRTAYLQSLGYEVLPEGEVREVLIPAEFDESFTAYNALQQEAGMDLSSCRGKRVKCWTYTVTNFPGDDTVQAHLYVYKDAVVGGDISSTRQGGVRQGLRPMTPAQAADQTERTTTDGTTG